MWLSWWGERDFIQPWHGEALDDHSYYSRVDFNPNLPGLFCELKFLGGGGIMAPPKISTMDGPINLKIGTDTE